MSEPSVDFTDYDSLREPSYRHSRQRGWQASLLTPQLPSNLHTLSPGSFSGIISCSPHVLSSCILSQGDAALSSSPPRPRCAHSRMHTPIGPGVYNHGEGAAPQELVIEANDRRAKPLIIHLPCRGAAGRAADQVGGEGILAIVCDEVAIGLEIDVVQPRVEVRCLKQTGCCIKSVNPECTQGSHTLRPDPPLIAIAHLPPSTCC